jgi:hypothetical protein
VSVLGKVRGKGGRGNERTSDQFHYINIGTNPFYGVLLAAPFVLLMVHISGEGVGGEVRSILSLPNSDVRD